MSHLLAHDRERGAAPYQPESMRNQIEKLNK
jgi:hypothetical protein